jgi:hypothetical protein
MRAQIERERRIEVGARRPRVQPRHFHLLRGALIERAAMVGRARASKRAAEALLKDVSEAQLAKLEALLVAEQDLKATPLAWLRNASRSPKADNAVQLVDRLRFLRNIGMVPEARTRIHEDRFEQFNSSARHGFLTRISYDGTQRTGGERFWWRASSILKPA